MFNKNKNKNKNKKTIEKLKNSKNTIRKWRILLSMWGSHNYTFHSHYTEPMSKMAQYITSLSGKEFSVDDLHEVIEHLNISDVSDCFSFMDSIISDFMVTPEIVKDEQDLYSLLDFSIACLLVTGSDAGFIQYTKSNLDLAFAQSDIIYSFDILTDINGNFKNHLVSELDFTKNDWLFRSFLNDSDVTFCEYMDSFDLPFKEVDEDYYDYSDPKDLSFDRKGDQNIDFLNDSSTSILAKTIETLNFISENHVGIKNNLVISDSDPVLTEILDFKNEFLQSLRDLALGIPVTVPNNENTLLRARNIELEYKEYMKSISSVQKSVDEVQDSLNVSDIEIPT